MEDGEAVQDMAEIMEMAHSEGEETLGVMEAVDLTGVVDQEIFHSPGVVKEVFQEIMTGMPSPETI